MADLFGTYDKRIKLTIDNSKVDSDVSWFPVTVFFTAAQAEEIFDEFEKHMDFKPETFSEYNYSWFRELHSKFINEPHIRFELSKKR